jgi:hypothetical protein
VPSALCGAGRAAPAACTMVSAITTDTEMTLANARAAGRDAGDRSMRKAGRKAWSWDDWNEAARVTSALLAAATPWSEASVCPLTAQAYVNTCRIFKVVAAENEDAAVRFVADELSRAGFRPRGTTGRSC